MRFLGGMILISLMLYFTPFAKAHSQHKHSQHKKTPVVTQTTQPIMQKTPQPEVTVSAPVSSTPHPLPWQQALTHDWHRKLIHFPIALGFFGGVLLMAGIKWKSCYPIAGTALLTGGVFGIAAYFTGETLASDFAANSPYRDLVERHEQLGISSAVLLNLGAIGAFYPGSRPWMWIYAVILLIVLTFTGFYGGWIAHG